MGRGRGPDDRDPKASSTTNLTDALVFDVGN
jgi:hypothetical protein